jgi:hypothetical protein
MIQNILLISIAILMLTVAVFIIAMLYNEYKKQK